MIREPPGELFGKRGIVPFDLHIHLQLLTKPLRSHSSRVTRYADGIFCEALAYLSSTMKQHDPFSHSARDLPPSGAKIGIFAIVQQIVGSMSDGGVRRT
jgi:hypothetical protein